MVFSRFCCVAFAENALLRVTCMASLNFAGHQCLPRSLASFRWTNETAMASFQLKCVYNYIDPNAAPKRFVQKFWQHLLTTAAFFASCRALDQQK